MNYYERHLGDLAKDTSHLSQAEFGAYNLLMDWYYANECAIPIDKVPRICRARTPREHTNAYLVANEFFSKIDGFYVHKRIEAEIAKYAEKSNKSATAARIRWQKAKDANALQTHSDGNALQSPVTNNTNTLTSICDANAIKALKEIDFSQWPSMPTNTTMTAWVKTRKAKRLPCTQPAMDMVRAELQKAAAAGFDAESCIWYAAAKGWGGFRFEWMRGDMLDGAVPSGMPDKLIEKLRDTSWANLDDETPQLESPK